MGERSAATLIPISDPAGWDAALDRIGEADVYHSSAYHRCVQAWVQGRQECAPYLLVCSGADGYAAAMPFLVRPVATVEGLEDQPHVDATSVEGYPGVVSTPVPDGQAKLTLGREFRERLLEAFYELGVVSFFGRQNPFLETHWLWEGLGETHELGSTVAIDCSLSEEAHLAQMTSHHRRNLRKVRKTGLDVGRDPSFARLTDFITLYRQTMDRVGAAAGYYYSDDYFHELTRVLGDGRIFLAIAELDGEAVNAALFLNGPSVTHYHLGATSERHRTLGASHVLFDEVRRWCRDSGQRWLHLGGGVGAGEDSLFRFKAGFSTARFPYRVVRLVVDRDATAGLVERRRAWLSDRRLGAPREFFPFYRAPALEPDIEQESAS